MPLKMLYLKPNILRMLFLGFSSGMPFFITASTLSIGLARKGVDIQSIAFFSIATNPYAFKFLWAPFVDRVSIPFLTSHLGRRRGWALFTQLALIPAILALGFSASLSHHLALTGFCAFLVALFSATQDIVLDAYRIEILKEEELGAGSAVFVFGYRLGMIMSGAGALYIAADFNWSIAFIAMAAAMLIGVITILLSPEPSIPHLRKIFTFKEAVAEPFKAFMTHQRWVLILACLIFYKIGDIFILNVVNVFYLDLGFNEQDIATAAKAFGLWATISGGFLGGYIVHRLGILPSLFWCGIGHAISNLTLVMLSYKGHDLPFLYLSVALENITYGMSTTALIAYMSSLCSPLHAATQYALLTSLIAFFTKNISACSGWFVEKLGWVNYFYFTVLAALPALCLVLWLQRLAKKKSLSV